MKKRGSFDTAARQYDRSRPSYPDAVMDWVIERTGVSIEDELLEIVPGTGQATGSFLRRGFTVHCVELGANLAVILREKYAGYPMTVDVGPFESWTPARPYRVRMIYCATAFHWLDPKIKYRKCHDLLIPDGHLTLLWNGPDSMSEPLIAQAYEILWAHCGGKKEEDREATMERRKAEIAESGLFELDNFLDYPWIHASPRRNFIEGFFAQSSYTNGEY